MSNIIDRAGKIHIASTMDLRDIEALMRALSNRKEYAKEYCNNPNPEAKEQLLEIIEYLEEDIKIILGL